ncbi:hypothetical protein NDU88_005684 [Pleurodeles waltl]|uniref:Uncharacterized protein n=1 Tax=Pleurodeles waltl TaxID=8319 RepID=A0AAV7WXS1_PLEWA|nr:hypothetical protein NDU88_005684 [Pleurodeles waltl]
MSGTSITDGGARTVVYQDGTLQYESTDLVSQNSSQIRMVPDTLSDSANERVELPDSMSEALIVLIPETMEASSYRPVTMLNVDQKILSYLLAARLLPHLE